MTPAASRSRRYRRRLRQNRAVVAIEVDLFGVSDALIERGFLSEDAGEDRQLLAAAIGRMVDAWAKETVRVHARVIVRPCLRR
jgi:hypothetical protein